MADSFPDDDASEDEGTLTNAKFISEPTGSIAEERIWVRFGGIYLLIYLCTSRLTI